MTLAQVEAMVPAFGRADHIADVRQLGVMQMAHHGTEDQVRRFTRRDPGQPSADAKFREAVRNMPN